jgi:large conductance mechanosensitive channel
VLAAFLRRGILYAVLKKCFPCYICPQIATIHLQNENLMLRELKAFLLRGDVVALAVAVIIGGAFGKVISSLVDDIISPILGMITGNPDFSQVVIGNILIGNFINAVINFVLVGTALFFVVKAAGKKPEDVK